MSVKYSFSLYIQRPELQSQLADFIKSESGLLYVTGVSGSGKSWLVDYTLKDALKVDATVIDVIPESPYTEDDNNNIHFKSYEAIHHIKQVIEKKIKRSSNNSRLKKFLDRLTLGLEPCPTFSRLWDYGISEQPTHEAWRRRSPLLLGLGVLGVIIPPIIDPLAGSVFTSVMIALLFAAVAYYPDSVAKFVGSLLFAKSDRNANVAKSYQDFKEAGPGLDVKAAISDPNYLHSRFEPLLRALRYDIYNLVKEGRLSTPLVFVCDLGEIPRSAETREKIVDFLNSLAHINGENNDVREMLGRHVKLIIVSRNRSMFSSAIDTSLPITRTKADILSVRALEDHQAQDVVINRLERFLSRTTRDNESYIAFAVYELNKATDNCSPPSNTSEGNTQTRIIKYLRDGVLLVPDRLAQSVEARVDCFCTEFGSISAREFSLNSFRNEILDKRYVIDHLLKSRVPSRSEALRICVEVCAQIPTVTEDLWTRHLKRAIAHRTVNVPTFRELKSFYSVFETDRRSGAITVSSDLRQLVAGRPLSYFENESTLTTVADSLIQSIEGESEPADQASVEEYQSSASTAIELFAASCRCKTFPNSISGHPSADLYLNVLKAPCHKSYFEKDRLKLDSCLQATVDLFAPSPTQEDEFLLKALREPWYQKVCRYLPDFLRFYGERRNISVELLSAEGDSARAAGCQAHLEKVMLELGALENHVDSEIPLPVVLRGLEVLRDCIREARQGHMATYDVEWVKYNAVPNHEWQDLAAMSRWGQTEATLLAGALRKLRANFKTSFDAQEVCSSFLGLTEKLRNLYKAKNFTHEHLALQEFRKLSNSLIDAAHRGSVSVLPESAKQIEQQFADTFLFCQDWSVPSKSRHIDYVFHQLRFTWELARFISYVPNPHVLDPKNVDDFLSPVGEEIERAFSDTKHAGLKLDEDVSAFMRLLIPWLDVDNPKWNLSGEGWNRFGKQLRRMYASLMISRLRSSLNTRHLIRPSDLNESEFHAYLDNLDSWSERISEAPIGFNAGVQEDVPVCFCSQNQAFLAACYDLESAGATGPRPRDVRIGVIREIRISGNQDNPESIRLQIILCTKQGHRLNLDSDLMPTHLFTFLKKSALSGAGWKKVKENAKGKLLIVNVLRSRDDNGLPMVTMRGAEYVLKQLDILYPLEQSWSQSDLCVLGGSNSILALGLPLDNEHLSLNLPKELLERIRAFASLRRVATWRRLGGNPVSWHEEEFERRNVASFSSAMYADLECYINDENQVLFVSDKSDRDPRKIRTFLSLHSKIFDLPATIYGVGDDIFVKS